MKSKYVNEKYQGKNTIGISCFRGDFICELGLNQEDFNKRISEKISALGPEYELLLRYDNVNDELLYPILKTAANSLSKIMLGRDLG